MKRACDAPVAYGREYGIEKWARSHRGDNDVRRGAKWRIFLLHSHGGVNNYIISIIGMKRRQTLKAVSKFRAAL